MARPRASHPSPFPLPLSPSALTYHKAGVDMAAGHTLVERIKLLSKPTHGPEVIAGIGGFAGLCALPTGMKDPVLVSCTDGVGTKLKVAFAMNIHNTVGIDLVAVCVNDLLTVGAKPLFFLDYFATGKLDVEVGEAVVQGIVKGCTLASCALIGGETAEMPGMYADGEYDLAGFSVGVVERHAIVDGTQIEPGDVLVGMASSGLHANGFSLARYVFEQHHKWQMKDWIEELGATLGEVLLTPTRIYAHAVQTLLTECQEGVRGLVHVSGGGLVDNIPRVLPEGLGARVVLNSDDWPAVFRLIQRCGPVDEQEMRRTFNLGVGFVVIVTKDCADKAIALIEQAGEHAFRLGEVLEVGDVTTQERVLFDC